MRVYAKLEEKAFRFGSGHFWRILLVVFLFAAGFFAGESVVLRSLRRMANVDPERELIPDARSFTSRLMNGIWKTPAVDTLILDIKHKHIVHLEEVRHRALEEGLLFSKKSDWVPLHVTAGKLQARAKIRLKGDLTDHLKGKKWSFRLKLRDGARLFGARVMSLQSPRTRSWERYWLILRDMRREGILAPRVRFVRVVLNGEDLGIYLLEEHFSKELLESSQRREGPLLAFDETDKWYWVSTELGNGAPLALRPIDLSAERVRAFGKPGEGIGPLASLAIAGSQRLEAFARGERSADEVFDVEALGTFLALSEIWSAWHGLRWHNVRFYFDPLSLRLEPLAYDVARGLGATGYLASAEEPWTRLALSSPAVARSYMRSLRKMVHPDAVRSRWDKCSEGHGEVIALLRSEWPLVSDFAKKDLQHQAGFIRSLMSRPASVSARILGEEGKVLEVRPRLTLPVELVSISGATVSSETSFPLLIPPRKAVSYSLQIPLTAVGSKNVILHCRWPGSSKIFPLPAIPWHKTKPEPIPVPVISSLPSFITSSSPGWLRVTSGSHRLDEDLSLPRGLGLEIAAGTTLTFAREAALIIRGGTRFLGTPDKPIRLQASDDGGFAGIFVEGSAVSLWESVEVQATNGIEKLHWTPTGGVTFYGGTVKLDHCVFRISRAEDALNIVRAEANLRKCFFVGTSSDAVDLDFVSGSISHCTFADVSGDALDVSGSQILVQHMSAVNIGDKAISVGEASHVRISELQVQKARFGVVSKDQSVVIVSDMELNDVAVGLAAYEKKAEFGPAYLEARRVSAYKVKTLDLCQRGSRLFLDNPASRPRYRNLGALQ